MNFQLVKRNFMMSNIRLIIVPIALIMSFVAYGQETEKISIALKNVSEGLVCYIGVGAMDMNTSKQVFLNGDDAFPMASTYKIAIAPRVTIHVTSTGRNLGARI